MTPGAEQLMIPALGATERPFSPHRLNSTIRTMNLRSLRRPTALAPLSLALLAAALLCALLQITALPHGWHAAIGLGGWWLAAALARAGWQSRSSTLDRDIRHWAGVALLILSGALASVLFTVSPLGGLLMLVGGALAGVPLWLGLGWVDLAEALGGRIENAILRMGKDSPFVLYQANAGQTEAAEDDELLGDEPAHPAAPLAKAAMPTIAVAPVKAAPAPVAPPVAAPYKTPEVPTPVTRPQPRPQPPAIAAALAAGAERMDTRAAITRANTPPVAELPLITLPKALPVPPAPAPKPLPVLDRDQVLQPPPRRSNRPTRNPAAPAPSLPHLEADEVRERLQALHGNRTQRLEAAGPTRAAAAAPIPVQPLMKVRTRPVPPRAKADDGLFMSARTHALPLLPEASVPVDTAPSAQTAAPLQLEPQEARRKTLQPAWMHAVAAPLAAAAVEPELAPEPPEPPLHIESTEVMAEPAVIENVPLYEVEEIEETVAEPVRSELPALLELPDLAVLPPATSFTPVAPLASVIVPAAIPLPPRVIAAVPVAPVIRAPLIPPVTQPSTPPAPTSPGFTPPTIAPLPAAPAPELADLPPWQRSTAVTPVAAIAPVAPAQPAWQPAPSVAEEPVDAATAAWQAATARLAQQEQNSVADAILALEQATVDLDAYQPSDWVKPALEPKPAPVAAPWPRFNESCLPSLSLLSPPEAEIDTISQDELLDRGIIIEQKLAEFKVKVNVLDAYAGPVITRYEVEPAVGVRGAQVVNLMKDLSRALGLASIRVVETIPGKTCMGLELPNPRRQMIRLSEILSSDPFNDMGSRLTIALGKDITGKPVVTDLGRAPHMLVAGTTGSGKSVGVNAMILSLLYKATPDEVRFIMVDPKMLELSVYDGIPHLLAPVVTDMKLAANALTWCVAEMEKRYRLMSAMGVRNLAGFNQKLKDAQNAGEVLTNPFSINPDAPEALEHLPFIVVVVDEFADLMMVAGKKIEELIARLAQKARAAGIHLILATQRPSVDVITGLIKANIPTRMAFQVSSKIDSRTILDQMGAEALLGQGDMLFLPPGTGYPQRIHGAFVADEEVHKVVEFLKTTGEPDYVDGILNAGFDAESSAGSGSAWAEGGGNGAEESDPLYDEAVQFVIKSRRASISSVQRQLRIGYNRAARLIEQMENAGLVSPMETNGSRTVLAAPAPDYSE